MDTAKIAIVAASGLGDALLFAVVAENLQRAGFDVTLHSTLLSQLNDWFPRFTVKAFPEKTTTAIENALADYDIAIVDGYSIVTHTFPKERYPEIAERYIFMCMASFDPNLVKKTSPNATHRFDYLSGITVPYYKKGKNMVENLKAICDEVLHLPTTDINNGITPPADLIKHKYPKRIIIHPTSTKDSKNWPIENFLRLARRLKKRGFEIIFTVSPEERKTYSPMIEPEFTVPLFSSIDDLARMVYESGYFIGNDSGIGHLASCLDVPTLSIFASKNFSKRWRPSWNSGLVVTPSLQFKILRNHWKKLLPVSTVERKFLSFAKALNKTKEKP